MNSQLITSSRAKLSRFSHVLFVPPYSKKHALHDIETEFQMTVPHCTLKLCRQIWELDGLLS